MKTRPGAHAGLSTGRTLPVPALFPSLTEIELRLVRAVVPRERDEMFALLNEYYAGALRPGFERDLSEKEWVLLWKNPETGRIRGFSTLMRLRVEVEGAPIVAFFSGDTVVDAERWGSEVTSRGIGRLIRHMVDHSMAVPKIPHYWFLISSTHKSYRLLPLVFRDFDPAPGRTLSPQRARILEALVARKFRGPYDPEESVIRFPNPTLFRWERAGAPEEDSDPYAQLFLERNPGYREGDRLVSLTKLSFENLTPMGRRLWKAAPP